MTLQEALYGGAYIPCFQLMLTATIRTGLPDDLRTHAFISSVFWGIYSLGMVTGPLLGGVLVDAYSYPVMMTAVAGETLMVMVLTFGQGAVRAWRLRRSV